MTELNITATTNRIQHVIRTKCLDPLHRYLTTLAPLIYLSDFYTPRLVHIARICMTFKHEFNYTRFFN